MTDSAADRHHCHRILECLRTPKKEVAKINASLPEEMLRIIFSFLPPKDLKAVILVCKLWSRVGQAPGLWSWITFHAWSMSSLHAWSISEQMKLPRLQNVRRLNITTRWVSEELMEDVALHPGLKVVDSVPRWTNLSTVRPELLARAFGKMEDLNLSGTSLTVDQLNCLFASLASDNKLTQKRRLDLTDNNLYADGIDPLVLAAAVIRFNAVKLSWPYLKLCSADPVSEEFRAEGLHFETVRHGVSKSIFDALGSSFSCIRHMEFKLIDLSAVDAEVLAEEVSKMRRVRLQSCSITPPQATALFTAIGEDGIQLRMIDLYGNDLSSVQPYLFIRPLQFFKGLYLNGTNLTTLQVETIIDSVGNTSNLTHLHLDGVNICRDNFEKILKVVEICCGNEHQDPLA